MHACREGAGGWGGNTCYPSCSAALDLSNASHNVKHDRMLQLIL
jgi:hypothetical protein